METVKHASAAGGQVTSQPVPPTPPTSDGWGAPVVSTPLPEEPPPAAATDPEGVLDELVEVIHGAKGALLASVDGFAIARSSELPDEPSHAAMLAAAVGLGHQLVDMGEGNELRQLVVDHDRGLLLVWPLGSNRVLAMLTMTTVDQVRLRTFVRSRASILVGGSE